MTHGAIEVAAIGTPDVAIVSAQNLFAVTPREVSALFAARALDSNKGRFGHVLVAGGSHGKSGAAAMCGMAALRIGAGLATVASPVSVMPTIAAFAAELMTEGLGDGASRYATLGTRRTAWNWRSPVTCWPSVRGSRGVRGWRSSCTGW